jgi:hypothetical protein
VDALTAIAVVLASLAIGVIGNVIASEIYEHASSLADKIIDHAVSRLPEQDQARYREEWQSHVRDTCGHLAKLAHAIGCLIGASKLSNELVKARGQNEVDRYRYASALIEWLRPRARAHLKRIMAAISLLLVWILAFPFLEISSTSSFVFVWGTRIIYMPIVTYSIILDCVLLHDVLMRKKARKNTS